MYVWQKQQRPTTSQLMTAALVSCWFFSKLKRQLVTTKMYLIYVILSLIYVDNFEKKMRSSFTVTEQNQIKEQVW